MCSNCQRLGLACSWPSTEPEHTTLLGLSVGPAAEPPTGLGLLGSGPIGPASTAASTTASTGASTAASTDTDLFEDAVQFSALLRVWSRREGEEDVFNVPDELADEYLLPESRARRLLEHRLMQNYLFRMSKPFPMSPSPEWTQLWMERMPQAALEHDNVLYSLLAHSATHLLSQEPANKELFRVRQAYLIAAMREQRRMLDHLTLENADSVCLSSLLMLISTFAMLHERTLEPYAPPVEWLRLGRGSGAVIWMSVEAMMDSTEAAKSTMFALARAPPRFGFDESYFEASNRDQLNRILETVPQPTPVHPDSSASSSAPSPPPPDDMDDASTREAYEKTLAYVGSIQKAILRGEPIYVLCRRIQGFTMISPPRFVDFVSECRPRALVILAHFFACVVQLSGVWWLGDNNGTGEDCIARRELRAMRSAIPAEWMGHMVWPLDMAGLT